MIDLTVIVEACFLINGSNSDHLRTLPVHSVIILTVIQIFVKNRNMRNNGKGI